MRVISIVALLCIPIFGIFFLLVSRSRRRRDEALARLREIELPHQMFVAEVKDYAIFRLDSEGRVETWNQGAERIYGYRQEDILGRPLACFFTPEDQAAGLPVQVLAQAAVSGSLESEGLRVRRDGTRFRALASLAALRDQAGQLTGFAKVTRDITEAKDTEARILKLTQDLEGKVQGQGAALREAEAIFKGFLRHAPSAVALKDLEGRFLMVNPRMEAVLGRPETEIIGRTSREFQPPDLVARIEAREQRVLGLRQAMETEEHWLDSDGTRHDFLCHHFPLDDAQGQCWGLGVICADITERKQAEQSQLESQKMESLGLLAGGIAHDFNNLLGAMEANLALALRERPPEAPPPEHLQVLEGLVEDASYLVQQMVCYSGKGPFKLEALNLNRMVEEMIHLLRGSVSTKAVLRYDTDPRLSGLEGDATQIRQLIMNLVMNASEALGEGGGTISIRTGLEHLGAPYIRSVYGGQGLEAGRYLSLEVADTGVGMTPDIRERMFDPFFTTKFTGRGLGLSAIQGIVKGHRGGIRVYSEPGKGTQFKVVLPAMGEETAVLEPVPEALDDFQGRGTVLVVEDEDRLRAAAVKLLNQAGFDTLQARDGLQALELADQHRERIRLIIMDLTMPRMDGEEAYRELRQRGIRTPVILSSGFHEKEALKRFRGQGLAGFLQKPYKYNVLIKMIRETLEA